MSSTLFFRRGHRNHRKLHRPYRLKFVCQLSESRFTTMFNVFINFFYFFFFFLLRFDLIIIIILLPFPRGRTIYVSVHRTEYRNANSVRFNRSVFNGPSEWNFPSISENQKSNNDAIIYVRGAYAKYCVRDRIGVVDLSVDSSLINRCVR